MTLKSPAATSAAARYGREDQRHRRCHRKHGDEIVEVHRGYHPLAVR
jgi:hypothetical protein